MTGRSDFEQRIGICLFSVVTSLLLSKKQCLAIAKHAVQKQFLVSTSECLQCRPVFYSAFALLTIIADRCNGKTNSVCPSVRHVPVFCPEEWSSIVRSSAWGRTIILVSEKIKFIRIFSPGITPSESVKVRHSPVASENLTNNRP